MSTLADFVQPGVRDQSRGPSPTIWAEHLTGDTLDRRDFGFYFYDDFCPTGDITALAASAAYEGRFGDWQVYGHTGATMTDAQKEGGVLLLGAAADNSGITLGSATGAVRLITPSTFVVGRDVFFEARVEDSTITATKHDSFVGLFGGKPSATAPLSNTDNTMATSAGWIGFHKRGNAPTDWAFGWNSSGGTPQYLSGLTTVVTTALGAALAAGQSCKLGFRLSKDALGKKVETALTGQTLGAYRRPVLTVFVDGIELKPFVDPDMMEANFPTDFLSPCISIKNQTATAPGTLGVDWVQCAQVAMS